MGVVQLTRSPRVVTRRRRAWTQRAAGAVMVAPAMVVFTLLVIVPVVLAVYLSLTDWNGFTARPGFVGLENYTRLFTNRRVGQAFVFTALLAVVVTLVSNAAGLGLAVMVSRRTRTNAFFRVVFFYPHMISPLIIGFLWTALLSTRGVINSYLKGMEQSGLPFLSDPTWARWSVIVVIVWATFGVNVVLYVAGLQSIPGDLYEAATVDGASAWHRFRFVTVPMLAPMITLNLVIVLIATLKTYDLVLSLTDGGPAGTTQTVAYLILNDSFYRQELGLASAQSVALMVVVGVAAVAVVLLRRRAEEKVTH